ncbi:MAG: hypothetical protein IBV52_04875 [Candidatus Bathyarchaeota archaeon]
MTIEVDIREIKDLVSALNKKIDVLIEARESLSVMMLAQRSLTGFLEEQPDIYSIDDVKVRYL